MKSLSRLEINRVRGTGDTFQKFMSARRFKGGIKNVAAVRLFLLWLDNGRNLPQQVDIAMPVGDLSRHDSVRCFDVAGLVSDDAINGNGKFIDPDGYTHGYTSEDLEAQRLAKAKAEEMAAAVVTRQKKRAARSARHARAKV